ncbi:MAG: hypothetical protein WCO55_01625 [Candidatus Falkowbacteria bacterium]
MTKRIIIAKKDLIDLYYGQKLSNYKIGKLYNCSFATVKNRMNEYGLKPLPRTVIQNRYPKKDFNGSLVEKAYMIGFRLGDFNVYQTSIHSKVIVVRCHTTCLDQVELMEGLFSKYGKVTVSRRRKSYHINCFLNYSFNFLLPKPNKVEEWIGENKKQAFSFAAGYVDAEANIGVYDGRARFKVDSYDQGVICWLYELFKKYSIECPAPSLIGKKGQIYDKEKKYKYNKDLYRVRVSSKVSLEKLLYLLKPYIKHKKRLADLEKCLINIHERN